MYTLYKFLSFYSIQVYYYIILLVFWFSDLKFFFINYLRISYNIFGSYSSFPTTSSRSSPASLHTATPGCGISPECGHNTRIPPLERTEFLSLSVGIKCQSVRSRTSCSPPLLQAEIFFCLKLIWDLYMQSSLLSSYVHLPCCAWKAVLSYSHPPLLALADFPLPLLHGFLRLEGRGLTNISFEIGHFNISCSLYWPSVCIYIHCHLLQEETSLIRAEWW